jgi:alkylhydroperoxidase family enzyme
VSSSPRIHPLEPADYTDRAREFFAVVEGPGGRQGGTRLNVIQTLARHPDLAIAYFEFGRYILRRSSLPDRLRELATLRTAWLCGSAYEWKQHARSAERDGISPVELEAIKEGPAASIWTVDIDRAVLQATDELKARNDLDDATWERLAACLDERQIMDLIFTVGCYTALAMALNAMRVQPEA